MIAVFSIFEKLMHIIIMILYIYIYIVVNMRNFSQDKVLNVIDVEPSMQLKIKLSRHIWNLIEIRE